jgi:hypothetical protein
MSNKAVKQKIKLATAIGLLTGAKEGLKIIRHEDINKENLISLMGKALALLEEVLNER